MHEIVTEILFTIGTQKLQYEDSCYDLRQFAGGNQQKSLIIPLLYIKP